MEEALHSSLGNPSFWDQAEDGIEGHLQEEEDRSAYLSMPTNGPPLAPAGLEREILHPEALASLHKRSAMYDLETDEHDQQTGTRYVDATYGENVCNVKSEHQQDTPLPSTEHAHVELRDAKQVLAERAAERETRKRERAMEYLPPRKRSRKVFKSSLSNASESAEQIDHHQHHAPTNLPAAHWPALDPSHADDSDSLLSMEEMRVISSLMTAQSIFIDRTKIYTSRHINKMTEMIWTALCKDALSEFSLKVHGALIWTHIGEEVSLWPEELLRVLASMDILARWWWVREELMKLLYNADAKVDDGEMDVSWEYHAESVRRTKGSAESG
ncbi:hypothetical protein PMIN01_00950 [Paraphaeosphaeria minitans]|uniref:Uncharacterized protein n=1 Tax=Paraphaeosphaeria minitans TaxID=565426 RepID=A0A9P6GT72_9PLEO|nr:hypothetical protein PMIN01_00950 [Paraphaeosphaeria minitans]